MFMTLWLHNKHKQHLCYLYQKIIVLMIFCSFYHFIVREQIDGYNQCSWRLCHGEFGLVQAVVHRNCTHTMTRKLKIMDSFCVTLINSISKQ